LLLFCELGIAQPAGEAQCGDADEKDKKYDKFQQRLLSQQQQILTEQQQQLTALQQQLKQLAAPATAHEAWQQLSTTGLQIQLAQLYLSTGPAQLPLATQLLETAQQHVQALNNPSLATLQQALNTDVKRLQSVPAVKITAISTALTDIRQTVGQLSSVQSSQTKQTTHAKNSNKETVTGNTTTDKTATEKAKAQTKEIQITNTPATKQNSKQQTTPANQDQLNADNTQTQSQVQTRQNQTTTAANRWYQRGWEWSQEMVGQFITIRHQQQAVLPVSKQRRQTALNNIQLALRQAQWALLLENATAYQDNLQSVEQQLISNFSSQTQLIAKIRKLASININPTLPSLDQSAAALTQALKQLQQQQTTPTVGQAENQITSVASPAQISQQQPRANTPTTDQTDNQATDENSAIDPETSTESSTETSTQATQQQQTQTDQSKQKKQTIIPLRQAPKTNPPVAI